MRKVGYIPKNYERRIIKRFALFPITIYGKCDPWLERRPYERRWLETVYIEQRYVSHADCWENCDFVDGEDYIKFRMGNK